MEQALHPITDTPDMGITLSDGCRLSARVWMPEGAGAVPAILEFLPYRKRDGTAVRDALTHPWMAARGYACVRVDMRGNGDSDGLMEDEYTPQELADAVEVIHWLAAQDWCSGKVGMMGISWGGFNALQVAALDPSPLRAIITLCSTVDRYADDIHFKGGCLLNENLGWGATMWAYSSRPPDPALRADWRGVWLQRLEAEPFLPSVWLRHQRRDDYWRHGSVCEDFGAIRAAVLAVGGWGDSYRNAVPALVGNLRAPVKGIVGPWVHKYPHFAVPEPRIGFLQEALRWWDRWLKDIPNGAEDDPPYRQYLMEGVRPATWYAERPGRWLAGDGAPSPVQRWHLGMGVLVGAEAAPFRALVASPQHCGRDAGEFCAIWLGPEQPGDQRADDALSACFDTGPLEQATAITGAPRATLTLASDKAQAQIAVRLCHVHPDGASTRITYGVLNLAHRGGHADPVPLVPGQAVTVTLDLDHIAYRVPAGHRLRVAVSSAYWPLLWPAPEASCLTLTAGHLDLPVHPDADGPGWVFPPPDAAVPLEVEVLRAAHHEREAATDMTTGIVTLRIVDDFGKTRDGGHGLISGGVGREWWSIHPGNPLSARGRTHWTMELERDGIVTRTETHAEMWSDARQFHLTARIEAWEGQGDQACLVHARDLRDSIDRDHL